MVGLLSVVMIVVLFAGNASSLNIEPLELCGEYIIETMTLVDVNRGSLLARQLGFFVSVPAMSRDLTMWFPGSRMGVMNIANCGPNTRITRCAADLTQNGNLVEERETVCSHVANPLAYGADLLGSSGFTPHGLCSNATEAEPIRITDAMWHALMLPEIGWTPPGEEKWGRPVIRFLLVLVGGHPYDPQNEEHRYGMELPEHDGSIYPKCDQMAPIDVQKVTDRLVESRTIPLFMVPNRGYEEGESEVRWSVWKDWFDRHFSTSVPGAQIVELEVAHEKPYAARNSYGARLKELTCVTIPELLATTAEPFTGSTGPSTVTTTTTVTLTTTRTTTSRTYRLATRGFDTQQVNGSSMPTGTIIGATFGGLSFLIISTGCIYTCRQRRQQGSRRSVEDEASEYIDEAVPRVGDGVLGRGPFVR